MEFKTAEQKLLHDFSILEEENARLEDENLRLKDRVGELEKRLDDVFEQAHRLEMERDQRADCIKDMLAMAKWYGIDQPTNVTFYPAAGLEAGE